MNQQLREEILRRVDLDQDLRHKIVHGADNETLWIKINTVDRDNTTWLKGTVDRHGWPTVSLVGAEASYAAWLLVQHADLDLDFQRQCLALMQQASEGEVDLTNIAYLEDRILGSEKKPLKYGTQYRRSPDNTKWVPFVIKDPEGVDERRAAMGLPTLEENMRQINTPEGSSVSNMPRHRK